MAKLSPDAKAMLMDALRASITESRTDDWIRRALAKLPFWLRWLPLGKILDKMMPEALINYVDENL